MSHAVPSVWVLADDRAGNVAQAVGVAEALSLPFTVKNVRYTRLAALPNLIIGASLLGVAPDLRAALAAPWPALVIAAGRRTAPVARWIAGHGGARLVQIMDPEAGRDSFDLIALPEHDDRPRGAGNILTILGAPHRVTPGRLAAEAGRWRDRLAGDGRPRVALIVGGSTKNRRFTPAMAGDLARRAAALAAAMGAGLIVTTSRRTAPDALAALQAALPEGAFLYRWGDAGDNPYPGLLGLADAVIVTGDSVSMCSEACAVPVPVYIFAPPDLVAPKHARLHAALYRQGYARPLDGSAFESWRHPPLNAADQIATVIRDRVLPAPADRPA
jgi:mitochondrial fission protein ELM1